MDLGAQRRRLDATRWHFQHGPIDLIIGADGPEREINRAIDAAWARFSGILTELVGELPLLRSNVTEMARHPQRIIARRMVAAVRPHGNRFVTPMAAVAGAVADEVIGFFRSEHAITRAYVNNGGDIAVHLQEGQSYRIGVFGNLSRVNFGMGEPRQHEAEIVINSGSSIRGIATSGWRGRSQSLGIADSVTILAGTAAEADAAATMVANAVNVDDRRIRRKPAREVRSDSDLGDRLVTVGVPPLEPDIIDRALDRGVDHARELIARNLIGEAFLLLQGHTRVVTSHTAMPAVA